MRLGRRGAGLALLALLLAAPVAAQEGTLPPDWNPDRFFRVADVRAGMTGVGRSVFQGSELGEFTVSILGVMETPSPRGTMILARLAGQDLEKSGIIAGMSGSPIFVEGKLLGALAFGWSFASEPICGITPIEEMLRLLARPAAPIESAGIPRSGMAPEAWESLLAARGEEALTVLGRTLGEPSGPESVRWSLPLATSGLGPGAGSLLSTWTGGRGLVPVEAGGTGVPAGGGEAELVPGSAVAVVLVRGDAALSAVGTVTWRDGDRVWAFGHPLFNLGAAAYPLAAADIVTVLPRLSSSFKMGGATRTIGAITRDYSAGIVGTLGPAPRLIPMEIDLAFGAQRQRVRVEILDAETWTPALAGLVAMSSMESLGRASGAGTLAVRTRIDLAGAETVEAASASAGFAPPASFAGEVARVVGLVHGNPFETAVVTGIHVEATLHDRLEASFLEALSVPPGPYRGGDRVPVTLTLRGYRGAVATRTVPFQLPPNLAPGSYRLEACDGALAARAEEERLAGKLPPRTLRKLAQVLSETPAMDEVVIRLTGPGSNPVIAGDELPRLPASLRPVLLSPLAGGRADKSAHVLYAEERVAMDGVILGSRDLNLTVEARR